ncbi:hypothetical protein [Cerasicoccus frondis]|uniref:hypothetical protein n=1 Tax=Cerasicoccus frondis TaxID=490090 RepID=UPI0028526323|nr:hypothetical protein [Cerasicoccus frondis]
MQSTFALTQWARRGALITTTILAGLAPAEANAESCSIYSDTKPKSTDLKLAPGTDIGMWVWRREYVADAQEQEKLIHFCQQFGISRIFVQVRFDELDGHYSFADADHWDRLLKSANAANIKVEALDGAGYMGFAEYREDTLQRLDAVLEFNENQPSDAKLAGLHYDIEPYVTERWKQGDQQAIASELLETMDQIRSKVKSSDPSLTIAHDIPFWYSGRDALKVNFNGSDKYLDEHIQDLSDFMGIMSYRTHMTGSNSVSAVGQEEIDYASQNGGKVYLSLETVPLEETPNITFHNKSPEQLAIAIQELSAHMEGQPGFGGIFIHCYRTAGPMLEAWAKTRELPATN